MIVCSCNRLSDGTVRAAIERTPGALSPAKLFRAMGSRPQCGRCAESIRCLLRETRCAAGSDVPVLAAVDRSRDAA